MSVWSCTVFAAFACALSGCGSTKSYTATDQLLMSDAVDATIAKLDFSPLAGKKVYLDTTYLKTQKSSLLIDSDYVISSIRQQMVGAAVFLVESRDEADLVAEARLGALGLDGHNVTYGIPASSALATASTAIASTPVLPILPEVSFARREAKSGAAKLAVFAYYRETREPYWQSGIAKSSSNAQDTWILGIGPWQRGTIYDRTRFAGGAVAGTDILDTGEKDIRQSPAFQAYRRSRLFEPESPEVAAETQAAETVGVVTAGSEAAAEDKPGKGKREGK
ncbi:MAG: hypothetical protein KDA45_00905 [Planctomycetales bacterium]|nr:hypothetical protein [Planctomycetales bacterium]